MFTRHPLTMTSWTTQQQHMLSIRRPMCEGPFSFQVDPITNGSSPGSCPRVRLIPAPPGLCKSRTLTSRPVWGQLKGHDRRLAHDDLREGLGRVWVPIW